MKSHSSPPWILVGGLLLAGWLGPPSQGALPLRIAPDAPPHQLLERGSVRELRALGGLGAKRAQALVAARGPKGELPPLEEVRGVGPRTAASLRAAMEHAQGR